eukprot:c932_g1_i1.p1 GENE.c932_g1_i1~~c932_g1_i1.p1  ORF type:complete len:272 (-),score=78.49 c932_g1_i1:669-1427(-)
MSSIGTGYDLSATTFSPDGRVFQVEYASKAVDNGGTTIGIRCKDGVVFGVEKLISSKMLVKGTSKRVHTLETNFGLAESGLTADGRQIANRAMSECENYRSMYGTRIPPQLLAQRVASYMHLFTLYWHVRPFGASVLIGFYDKTEGAQLYLAEPSGLVHRYFACAIGKGRQGAKTELEKLKLNELTCRQALVDVARIIHSTHDENKDKPFELEMSWICDESGCKHQLVPDDLVAEAEAQARNQLNVDNMDDA